MSGVSRKLYGAWRNIISTHKIYNSCGEYNIYIALCSESIDPVVEFYIGAQIMITTNDVIAGTSNKTQATVK